jgi:hypothetical protein
MYLTAGKPAIRERDANDDDHYLRESGHRRHAV